MIFKTSIEVECDSCGRTSTISDGLTYGLTGPNGNVIEHQLNLKLASTADLANVFITDDWVMTGSRNTLGDYQVWTDAAKLPRQIRTASHFLVCPNCAPEWLPPFSENAARELQRMRTAQAEGDDEVSALRSEVARLRGVIDTIRSEVTA